MLSATGRSGRFFRGAILLAVVILPLTGATQQTEDENDRRWLAGASLGIPSYDEESIPQLFTIGGHWTYFRPNRVGADFAVMVAPIGLLFGALPLGARAGIAVPVTLAPGFTVVPSTGASLLGLTTVGGPAGALGFNWGLAAVTTDANGWGVRLGMSWHRFSGLDAPVGLLEFGLVRGPRFR